MFAHLLSPPPAVRERIGAKARRAWRAFEARVLLPLAFLLAAPLIAAGGFAAADWLWVNTHPVLALLVGTIAVADTLFALAAACALAMEPK